MKVLRTGVFVLFVLLVPVSCEVFFFTEPVTCYFLDGILIIYCIIATAFYFREKLYIPSVADEPISCFLCFSRTKQEDKGGIYQELERPKDADPYEVLDPSKRKKKAGKKKKSEDLGGCLLSDRC
ncbi:T-cell surface glycoprotein CD3 zeta chain-like isoform X2 [Chelmon rostratus]|uniref:T-cell surface glycoprotein CD3 zeta chain-like isoform X2 n=1 Tax=Chelmon rostratus TaxID=109905 RepID=UPI001BE7D0F3|nr:T-cell surface glycoprotein CD3 zeta chain-like isoform X2 [Chelmon rostratus]